MGESVSRRLRSTLYVATFLSDFAFVAEIFFVNPSKFDARIKVTQGTVQGGGCLEPQMSTGG